MIWYCVVYVPGGSVGRYRQMSGRAGRAGQDTEGESILCISWRQEKLARSLLHADLPQIQSCLHEPKPVAGAGGGSGRGQQNSETVSPSAASQAQNAMRRLLLDAIAGKRVHTCPTPD